MPADWRLPRLQFGTGYRLTDATPEALAWLAQHLRHADQEEAFAATGSRDFAAVLAASAGCSDDVLLATAHDGEPLAVFGVVTVSLLSGTGAPWMLASDRAQLHQRALVRGGRAYAVAMLEQYGHLENWVDARNRRAVAWLRRCGFTVHAPRPFGALGMPFHRFTLTR